MEFEEKNVILVSQVTLSGVVFEAGEHLLKNIEWKIWRKAFIFFGGRFQKTAFKKPEISRRSCSPEW